MYKLRNYQPIAVIVNKVILYKKGRIYALKLPEKNPEQITTMRRSFSFRLKEMFRLSRRLFRTEVRSPLVINENTVVFFQRNIFYKLDMQNNNMIVRFTDALDFHTPLHMSRTLKTTKDAINISAVFGEYYSNPNNESVKIIGLDNEDNFVDLLTFPKGTIRHVHNVIIDEFNNGYYIFTGDNEDDAGIYWIDHKFSALTPINLNASTSRAVIGMPVSKSELIYATDNVSEINAIYKLHINSKKNTHLSKVQNINGPVIYGQSINDALYISTTVESEETARNKFMKFLSNKKASGVLSNEVKLMKIFSSGEITTISSYKKDAYPYKLFQYGNLWFPAHYNTKNLVFYPKSVKLLDQCTCIKTNV